MTNRAASARLSRWWVVDVLALLAGVYGVGRYATAFAGFPKGYDAWGHLSKVHLLLESWPHVNWNGAWYAGQPFFAGSYPPGYHALVAVLSTLTGSGLSGLATAMIVVAAFTMMAVVLGTYASILALSSSRVAALCGALVLMASPTLWDQELELGLYPRLLGLGFAALAVAAAAFYARRQSRARVVVAIVCLVAALSTHPVSGLVGVGLVAAVILCCTGGRPWRRLLRALAIAAAALCASAYFYLPLVVAGRSQSAFASSETPLRWYALFWPVGHDLGTLPALLLPSAALLVVGVLWRRRDPCRRRWRLCSADQLSLLLHDHEQWARAAAEDRGLRSLAGLFALGALVVVAYGLIGYVDKHFSWYVNGLQPRDLLVFAAWLLAMAVPLGGYVLLRHTSRSWRRGLGGTWLVLAIVSLAVVVPMLPGQARHNTGPAQRALEALLPPGAHHSTSERIAGLSDATSRWLNALTSTPQLRGYDDHGNLHLNWQYWIEDSLGGVTPSTPRERRVLLNYYAIGWLITDTAGSARAVETTPGLRAYRSEHRYGTTTSWTNTSPTPIVTATNAPEVLVVGDAAHYDLVLRDLALAGIGPRRLVPVNGGPSLDALSAAELEAYPTVLVYGARATKAARDDAALAAYARSGGHLVIDTGDSKLANALAKASSSPLPIGGTHPAAISGRWDFHARARTVRALSAGALGHISPPRYDASPWAVRAARSPVRAGATLVSHGHVVVAKRHLGAGSVLWSGLNLPYHVAAFRNVHEAGLLARLLGAARASVSAPIVHARAPDAEAWDVRVPRGAHAVLVRSYTDGHFSATLGGHPVPIELAGPDMMLVHVPRTGGVLRITYHLGPVALASDALALLSLLVLAGYAIVGSGPLEGPARRAGRRVGRLLGDHSYVGSVLRAL